MPGLAGRVHPEEDDPPMASAGVLNRESPCLLGVAATEARMAEQRFHEEKRWLLDRICHFSERHTPLLNGGYRTNDPESNT